MLHKIIKELRLKNNLTQNQVAEALHISQNAYCLIEGGKTRLLPKSKILNTKK
jgi:transcriptional regulator with XRE-family HTH domain